MRRLWLLAAGLAACGDAGFVERPTQVVTDPAAGEFWSLPLPSDRRQGATTRYGLGEWPDINPFLGRWLDAADVFLTDGWGLSSGVFMPLSGAVDAATLPADARASLGGEASVFLLDIDPRSPERGRRLPIVVSIPAADALTPENLLAAIPAFGFARRPRTTYALVVTDRVLDADGERLGRSRAFHAAFEEEVDADAQLSQALAPLRATLDAESYPLGGVIGAAVFTTLDPDATLLWLRDWTEALPAPTLSSPWVVADDYESFQVLTATYDSPRIQLGSPPYSQEGDGHFAIGADGAPEIQDWQAVRLALAIPKRPMPAGGFPLTLYLHGSGGDWREGIDRGPKPELPDQPVSERGLGPAEWLARRGVALLGFDFPLHGNRHSPPDTTGLMFYNLTSNPQVTVVNFHVAVMEALRVSRLALGLTVDAALASSLDAGGAADNLVRFDPEQLAMMGQSMGTTLGIPFAAVDPRVRAAVLSGAGGSLVEIGSSAIEPVVLNETFSLFAGFDGPIFHEAHPMLHALQNLWDLVDPQLKAKRLQAEPYPGTPRKDVLMTAGFRDGYFAPNAEAAVAVPLGAPLAGAAVEPILADAMALAHRAPTTFPVRGNLDGRTGAVLNIAAPYNLGHYVVFNQEGARFQYTCFLSTLGAPGGPVIPGPAAFSTPCP